MYVDGFILAVPTAGKEAYCRHAAYVAEVFKQHGALSLVQCWGDDVPEGKLNSVHTAVLRQPDEAVVFAWIIWPDRAARDEGMKRVSDDARVAGIRDRIPFDGARMIVDGFEVLVEA